MSTTGHRERLAVKFGTGLITAFGVLTASLSAETEYKSVVETFQHDVCDVAAIFSRLSGTGAKGAQHESPTDEPYRTFALGMARRNGFEEPRAIGGAMNGRAAFICFYDSSRTGPYAFAVFVADYTAADSAASLMTSLLPSARRGDARWCPYGF